MLTRITKYKTEGRKRTTADSYRRQVRRALLSLARRVILCDTPEHVDAAAALAQAASSAGMNNRNYLLFLALLETNHPVVIDILVGPRNPFLLFSSIKPNWFLLRETFRILAKFKGNELFDKALLALLGIVQGAYKTSKDGYKIYPLRMSDIYNIGKHLAKDRDQLDPRNRLLLEILFDIYFVGIDSESRAAKQIGIKANDIRMAFFDNTKRLLDAIPDVLLVRDIVGEAVGPRHFRWVPPDAVVEDGLTSRESPELKPTIAARRTAPADAGAGSPPVPGLRGASKVTERRSAKKAPPGKGGKKGLVPSRRTRPQNPGQATPSRGRKRR